MDPAHTENDEAFIVTDGSEVIKTSKGKLKDLKAKGYYRPDRRGLTIVGDGSTFFEVPLGEVNAATLHGFRNLLPAAVVAPSETSKLDPGWSTPAGLVVSSTAQSSGTANAIQETFASDGNGSQLGDSLEPVHAVEPVIPSTGSDESAQSKTALEDTKSSSTLETPSAPETSPSWDFSELSELDQVAEQALIEREQSIEAEAGWRRHALQFRYWLNDHRASFMRQLGGSGISILIHIAIILILASFVLVQEKPPELLMTAISDSDNTVIEEIIIEPVEMEVTEPTEDTEVTPQETELVSVDVPMDTPDFMDAISGDAVKPPEMPAAKPAKVSAKKPTFFGSKFAAINYVFVIDNSNSMTRGRFETAIMELTKTINLLTPKQRFYVIFYSDTAYPMMHPRSVKKLVSATPKNKQALFQWLLTVELCLRTKGKQALQAAFDLNPDVIYVLGDGAFTDKAADFFVKNPHPKIIVNTRGMEVKPKDAVGFKKLATAHRGNYMDVGVNPAGAEMAKRKPVRRNNVRGPIWGITLPLTPPNKK
ncbi:VWA domain-containing protein [Neorhodopirellula lusitana]|uniref:VWA domain-containing protein n=1 Tax=Neorhodopirellula lusitana TaxID=445327 RepID=UPI00384AABFA